MASRGSEFANIVYTILVVEKSPDVAVVAAGLGISYSTLHSRLINRTCFSADEIRALLQVVPDARLVAYLLQDSAFVAADRPQLYEDSSPEAYADSIQRRATRAVVEVTDVLEVVDAALAGGRMDHRYETLLLDEIDEAERALASLRVRLQGDGH
ncbi:phage regulatory CII family protein [Rhizobium sp. S96]|uniref:phage regulatory CII family protein n=1 Tax=Rhizobium sp. S96 TaxID=3055140 RepID=UPI0025AB2CC4|nr:phage regulatory CII family protein [Rhizobium sp. S96]MDM9624033.1 hypothetical protein [Rhizobium sp. S96]